LSESAVATRIAQVVAWLGLLAALAAMTLPTSAGYTPEIASVLAVGSIAVLAGHAWGLLIVALADVLLIGKVWPVALLAAGDPQWAGIAALVGALPGLLVLSRTLPRTVEVVLGRADSPWRSLGIASSTLGVGISLLTPMFS
jgi:hypothetical protein